MLKSKFTKGILSLALMVFTLSTYANEIPEDVIYSIKAGNSKTLADFFYSSIELQVLETENIYSRLQAEQVIKEFFNQYPPSSFVVNHQSGKPDSPYAIGTLKSGEFSFKVFFLLKKSGTQHYLHQLSIEKE